MCGNHVHHISAVTSGNLLLVENAVSLDGRQSLIVGHERHRQGGTQPFKDGSNTLRGVPFAAVEPVWHTDYHNCNLPFFNESRDAFICVRSVLGGDYLKRSRYRPGVIGNRYTDAFLA